MTQHVFTFAVRQIFDWIAPDGNASASWRVSDILDAILDGKIKPLATYVAIDPEWARTWLPSRDLDPARVEHWKRQLSALPPVLFAAMPDGTYTLIDGGHRYMACFQAGLDEIPSFLLAEDQWQPYATIKGDLGL